MRALFVIAAALLSACGAGGDSCTRYLSCLQKSEPGLYEIALDTYGPQSACGKSSAAEASCEAACLMSLAEECGCTSDGDCRDIPDRTHCDVALKACVECTASSQCKGNLDGPFCDPSAETCGQCLTDHDCPSATPACASLTGVNPGSKVCAQCDDAHACPGAGTCNPAEGTCS